MKLTFTAKETALCEELAMKIAIATNHKFDASKGLYEEWKEIEAVSEAVNVFKTSDGEITIDINQDFFEEVVNAYEPFTMKILAAVVSFCELFKFLHKELEEKIVAINKRWLREKEEDSKKE